MGNVCYRKIKLLSAGYRRLRGRIQILSLSNDILFFISVQIFGWLEGKLGKYRSLPPDMAQCVPILFAGLEDRSADVRKNTTAVLPLFMMHLTYEKMIKMTSKLKVSLEKLRQEIS